MCVRPVLLLLFPTDFRLSTTPKCIRTNNTLSQADAIWSSRRHHIRASSLIQMSRPVSYHIFAARSRIHRFSANSFSHLSSAANSPCLLFFPVPCICVCDPLAFTFRDANLSSNHLREFVRLCLFEVTVFSYTFHLTHA